MNPHSYGRACAALIPRATPMPLGPGVANQALHSPLSALDEARVVDPHALADTEMAQCCISALWLRHDFLDESHKISQSINSVTGSYWHGIMHRREPDYPNAKYWFQRVGQHPLFDRLCDATHQMMASQAVSAATRFLSEQPHWDPFAFVDLCQHAARRGGADETTCRQVAELEWQLLFDYCYQQAIGR